MATASVTYTFVAATAAKASEVNTNFSDLVTFLNNSVVHKDGSVTMTGALTLPSSDPTADDHAARKKYVDDRAGGASGTIVAYGGSSAPSGWLLCFGQAVSRTTYATLFAVIGTTFGSGDGSTTFNVPDLRGRIPIGKDNMGGTDAGRSSLNNTVGATVDALSDTKGLFSQAVDDSFFSNTSVEGQGIVLNFLVKT